MRCQHFYDCDPGDIIAQQCSNKATAVVEFSYRHGEVVERQYLCKEHAQEDCKNLKLWGAPYGHKACVVGELRK